MQFDLKMGTEAVILVYLLVINLIAFAAMGIDKWKARHHKWRIPEKTLFLFVLIGGSIGGIAGMQFFRHKTKHKSFVVGFPSIFLIQMISCAWILLK